MVRTIDTSTDKDAYHTQYSNELLLIKKKYEGIREVEERKEKKK